MNVEVAIVLFASFAFLLALGAPIYLALGLSSLLCIVAFELVPLELLPSQVQGAFSSFTLLAIPFFILAGNLLASSELTVRLIELARVIVGRVRGGLAIVAVLTGVFFAGISGSGPADTAALSATLLRPLRRDGYSAGFAAGLLAATGAIGIIMPPSIALIIYGVVSGTSVGRLFIAGVLPAIVVAICLSAVAVVMARRHGWGALGVAAIEPADESEPAGARGDAPTGTGRVVAFGRALRRSVWGLLAPLIILGGIYGGIFTPTEAAAVVVVYALFVGFVVYRDLKPASLFPVLSESVRTTGVVMIIIASASIFAYLLNTQGIAAAAGGWLSDLPQGKLATLVVSNLILLLAGAFLDAISIFYIFVPILLPVAIAVGVDPVHFGIIATVNLAIGMVTPPVGVNLYVAAAIGRLPVTRVARGVAPIIVAELVALVVVNAFPQLSLWLPDALGIQ